MAAIVLDPENQTVFLTEQFKFPTHANGDGWIVEVVAGTQEEGESPEDALAREVEEEIGFAVKHLEPIATFYLSPGGTSERIFLYCAIVSGADQRSAGGGLASEGEDIRVLQWPVATFVGKLGSGQLQDAKTLIAGYWLKENWDQISRG